MVNCGGALPGHSGGLINSWCHNIFIHEIKKYLYFDDQANSY